MSSLIDALFHRRALRSWTRAAKKADSVDLTTLRQMRRRARELRSRVNSVLHVAESRLALPAIGSNAIQRPLHTDWAYRPELWRGPVRPLGIVAASTKTRYGAELEMFHDCRISELSLRQIRNTREEDLAPFGLRVDVFRFDGSFLSLALELPSEAVVGLERRHLLRLTSEIEVERPLDIFARLNVKNGPNVEQIVRELPTGAGEEMMVEFDLAYTKLNEKRVERMWLELIFEGAEMNQFILRDLALTRRPRAEI